MTRTAARRPGLSLLEVIVALFVMALGMISLLTLFPLGAVQMGQALRDARAAETAVQADTHMRIWWQRDVVERPGAEDPAFAALDHPSRVTGIDPTHPLGSGATEAGALLPTDLVASYPMMIDPISWQAFPVPRRSRLAGDRFPRRTMGWIDNLPAVQRNAFSFRTATMMDDITFGEDGRPDTTASGQGTPVVRMGRYNWAAVIQRPVNANRYVADLKVLVFDGRPPGVAPADAELVLTPAAGSPVGTQQIILTPGAVAPDFLKAGSWIMDGMIDPATNRRNAVWYRIQAIDRDSLPGQLVLDLQTPLVRQVFGPPAPPATTPVASRFYAFKGLLEVFDRPQLTPPNYKKQLP
jgi:hypothetical protein